MKKITLLLLFFSFFNIGFAQKTYTINGETLELKTEVEGNLDLLWTVKNKQYRYFVRTEDGTITELKNNRRSDKSYDEDYKKVLESIINTKKVSDLSASKTKLTTPSLIKFVDAYNKITTVNYDIKDRNLKVNFRLSLFAGLTNNPLVNSIDNNTVAQLAAELELFGNTDNPIHSGLLQIRQTFDTPDDYRSTEISLGYRVRFLRQKGFNIYAQTRFATLNNFKVNSNTAINDTLITETENGSEFEIPFIFGIGADIKISKKSYISVLYDRFYAFGLDGRDDFPTDIMIGYKLNL